MLPCCCSTTVSYYASSNCYSAIKYILLSFMSELDCCCFPYHRTDVTVIIVTVYTTVCTIYTHMHARTPARSLLATIPLQIQVHWRTRCVESAAPVRATISSEDSAPLFFLVCTVRGCFFFIFRQDKNKTLCVCSCQRLAFET